MKSSYSSSELARLLQVNESTVKRWADAGELSCAKTRGGHRRFSVATVMDFIQRKGLPVALSPAAPLATEDIRAHVLAGNIHRLAPALRREMLAGSVQGIVGILRTAFVAKPHLLDVFSTLVFPPLVDIGEEWHRNTLSIHEEHIASNALREALAQFHAEIPRKDSNGLRALCVCPEGEWHDITIRCTAYFLESMGWAVLFMGQSSPIHSIVRAIGQYRPDLIAVSAVAPRHERALVNAINGDLYPAARHVRARLALGGPAISTRWKDTVRADHLCDSISDCEALADPGMYRGRRHGGRGQ